MKTTDAKISTPFTYSDAKRQDKNEKGHAAQSLVFQAYEKGEDKPDGVSFKNDIARDIYGNWAIEFKDNQGRPSGIATTPCLFWHSMSSWDSLFLLVERLRCFISETNPQVKSSCEGAKNYIIKDSDIREWLRKTYYKK